MTRRSGGASDARLRAEVRDRYGRIASESGGGTDSTAPQCCDSSAGGGCCGDPGTPLGLGYTPEEVSTVPHGADLGLGCGNPTAILRLRPGQSVVDLGSGAGIDCFLAAKKVGPNGSVLGVDMAPEMVSKARANARRGGYRNVRFLRGEIQHLPIDDASVDVVISNCVLNLAPDQGSVYREAFRVLRPGGELAVSDMVATRPISARERADPQLWASCSSGALRPTQVRSILRRAGFVDVQVKPRNPEGPTDRRIDPASYGIISADIRARKPYG